ncbi:hypothetical protein ACE4Z5_26700, partial [Salmonella enterica]|uniref:hypothetical protein n=1 Tax=Salmonella enterica TaxID=28901 RepID=UPI003D28218A
MKKRVLAFLYCVVCSVLIGLYRGLNDDAAGIASLLQMLLTGMASLLLFFYTESEALMGFLIGFAT